MQNNVTYLSRKLQRSLDNNYNVIDMPAVIEIISTLEKTSVTKELLETTRLGKYINELRRKTSNDSLAKRAKELLKKWRDLIRSSSVNNLSNPDETPKNHTKKRPASSTPPDASSSAKKHQINGQNREYDFSDNSNCSVKELKKTDVIFINSDSNSSMPESLNPGDQFDVGDAQPKKRGRKKGSKNHKNLVIAAEESFTNKMAVSRNSKVKTTQELLADIQNRKPSSHDIELRTAQLTESLTRIEHKLNPQKIKNKPLAPIVEVNEIISDDEIVDVVGTDVPEPEPEPIEPLTIENLLQKLPPIDPNCLEEQDDVPGCECPTPKVTETSDGLHQLPERITVQITSNSPSQTKEYEAPPAVRFSDADERTSDCVEENLLCPAKLFLADKYRLDDVDDGKIAQLHGARLPNVNGNFGAPPPHPSEPAPEIVPNFVSERLNKTPNENFQKYSISIEGAAVGAGVGAGIGAGDRHTSDCDSEFREWHETLDVISYNEELLRILPYVIID